MKIVFTNGPGINLLGIRQPEIYGRENYADLCCKIARHCVKLGVDFDFFQSNHEGDIVDYIQSLYGTGWGIVINPAAYTHTSVAIYDALLTVNLPAVEVHISDINSREEFRRHSYISPACLCTISGHGTEGYIEAADCLAKYMKK